MLSGLILAGALSALALLDALMLALGPKGAAATARGAETQKQSCSARC